MDTKRLKELGGVPINENMPGFGDGFGAERSNESQVIDMVLGNLRVLKTAIEQGDMNTAQEELQKAIKMLVRSKTGK